MVGKVSQSDFGAGMWRSGNRDRVPENGSGDLQEFLLAEDGLAFERGGATRKSNAAVGSAGLLWVWDGRLPAGQRTVFGAASDTAVLDANDASPLSLGFVPGSTGPIRPVVVAGQLMIPSTEDPTVWKAYAGSRVAVSTYSTGTVTVTNDSITVTGAGTSWLANADAGMLLDSGSTRPFGIVARVVDNTTLELVRPWSGATAAGAAYTLRRLASVSLSRRLAPITASIANRLVGIAYDDLTLLRFSAAGDPATFAVDDYHQFTAQLVGLAGLRDVLMVFTSAGVYAVSNLAYNLASVTGDPQQRVELVNADLIAWGHEGIAPWSGALVVPARDGIWLIDPVSSPQKISLPIDDLYLSYVNAGYKAGVAEVFNGHYFLPVLNASNVWQDTLVCRLTQSRSGPPFGWSRLRGADAQVAAFAERSGTARLLAASTQSSSRVLDCTSFFAPAAGVKLDADGSTRQAVWESREFALSDMPTTVRRVRVWYELTNPGSGTPTVEFAYAKDSDTGYTVVSNSLGTYQGTGIIAGWENDGTLYNQWPVNKKARGMRFRLRTTGDNAGFKIRQVELVTEAVQSD